MMKKAEWKARYEIQFYNLDLPICVYTGYDWPAILKDGELVINCREKDRRLLLNGYVRELSHPMLGPLKAYWPEALMSTFILAGGSSLTMETEETPGLLIEKSEYLEPSFLEVTLANAELTDIPYSHAFAGLSSKERRELWEARMDGLDRKLWPEKDEE